MGRSEKNMAKDTEYIAKLDDSNGANGGLNGNDMNGENFLKL